ncbi:centromere-associated protein E-like isoform X3 [Zophobas morio]|uniref:centromere-associated protein E-like isoform X3 n=1 Tax=Zophobas morio TaxID=2755281 RepID=UPI003082D20C
MIQNFRELNRKMSPAVPRFSASCFLSFLLTKISHISPFPSLWVTDKFEKTDMRINWKALLSLGFAFWGLLCCTDLLGESTWKRCSHSLDEVLKDQYNHLNRVQDDTNQSEEAPKQKMSWPILLWNVCAFLCSLVFCSVIRNRKVLASKIGKIQDTETSSEQNSDSTKSNCKIIFKNQLFTPKETGKMQEQNLGQVLEEVKKEKHELAQQLVMAQKENLTAQQQIEEYKLETFMVKEKLARTANTLKENLKYKDFANANQELIARKAHNLELHLKEVCRDRDILRAKYSNLEKSHTKLEEKVKILQKQESESNIEQFPEKDTSEKPTSKDFLPQITDTEADICKFQKKIMELQRSIGAFETKKANFEANSKISVDLEESSMDTSKENESELLEREKKGEISSVKQNLINYNAYKVQMLRPRLKLGNIKERLYSTDTGSSSDDNSGPRRIISSTIEFQNFLKTLASNSKSSLNFHQSNMF